MLPDPHPWDDLTGLALPLPSTERGAEDGAASRPSWTQAWAGVTHFWGLCPQECGLGQRHTQHSAPVRLSCATSLALTVQRHLPWLKKKSPGGGRVPGGSQPT